MKKFGFVFSLFAASMFAGEWTGTISDAKCAKAHADASEKSMSCVKGCVKGGQAAVFVTGDKVIKIGNQDKVTEHLGHKVTVTGNLEGDTLTIASVKMAS
ncbi:MAG: hypothetical protein H7039_02185 [Bryobacteraceae bacterium]|nr:hypothetical protein [Bryobacteraceae bacterium]